MDVPVSKASLLLGYVSLAQSLGKVVFGKLTDNQRVHRLYLDQASLLIVSLCHTLCPLFSNYPMLVVYTIIFGFFEGCFHAMVVVISGDIVGKGNLHNALGSIYLMCSFSSIFGPPLAGYLYTSTGSYDAAFFVCGAVVAFSACLMFLIPWFISEERIITQEKVLLSDNSPGSDEKSKFFLHKTTLAIENTDKIINSKDKEISKLFFDSDRAMERLTAV